MSSKAETKTQRQLPILWKYCKRYSLKIEKMSLKIEIKKKQITV